MKAAIWANIGCAPCAPDSAAPDCISCQLYFTGLGIVRCDIPGLVSRVDKPLDFLGLYKTEHEASMRAHIPAKEISGELF